MWRLTGFVAAGALLAAVLAACSSPAARPARQQASVTASAATTAAGTQLTVLAADGLSELRAGGSRAVESTEPSKLDASAAVRKARWAALEGTTTVVTVVKARVTDGIVHDRLCWVIGAAPVVVRLHGGSGNPPGVRIGRAGIVIDANTGAVLESDYRNIPSWIR